MIKTAASAVLTRRCPFISAPSSLALISPDRFARLHQANEMIGEGCMRPLQLISRHLTGHALLCPDRADLGDFLPHAVELWIRSVTGATLRIIKPSLAHEVFVGIVTGGAAYTLV